MCAVIGSGLLRKLGLRGFPLFLSCHPSLLKEAAVLANERQVWEFPERGPLSALLFDVLHLAGLTLATLDAEGLHTFPREEVSMSRFPLSPVSSLWVFNTGLPTTLPPSESCPYCCG